jgi:hypothetical protein
LRVGAFFFVVVRDDRAAIFLLVRDFAVAMFSLPVAPLQISDAAKESW